LSLCLEWNRGNLACRRKNLPNATSRFFNSCCKDWLLASLIQGSSFLRLVNYRSPKGERLRTSTSAD
jgi:hypothetical protein